MAEDDVARIHKAILALERACDAVGVTPGEHRADVTERFMRDVLEAVQRVCAEQGGHEWVMTEDGDSATPYHAVWTCCAVCGAPEEQEEP